MNKPSSSKQYLTFLTVICMLTTSFFVAVTLPENTLESSAEESGYVATITNLESHYDDTAYVSNVRVYMKTPSGDPVYSEYFMWELYRDSSRIDWDNEGTGGYSYFNIDSQWLYAGSIYYLKIYEHDYDLNEDYFIIQKIITVGDDLLFTDKTDYAPGEEIEVSAFSIGSEDVIFTLYDYYTADFMNNMGGYSVGSNDFANLSWTAAHIPYTYRYRIQANFSSGIERSVEYRVALYYNTNIIKKEATTTTLAPGDTVTISTRVTGPDNIPIPGIPVCHPVQKMSTFSFELLADYETIGQVFANYTVNPILPTSGITDIAMNASGQTLSGSFSIRVAFVNMLESYQTVSFSANGNLLGTLGISAMSTQSRTYYLTDHSYNSFLNFTQRASDSQGYVNNTLTIDAAKRPYISYYVAPIIFGFSQIYYPSVRYFTANIDLDLDTTPNAAPGENKEFNVHSREPSPFNEEAIPGIDFELTLRRLDQETKHKFRVEFERGESWNVDYYVKSTSSGTTDVDLGEEKTQEGRAKVRLYADNHDDEGQYLSFYYGNTLLEKIFAAPGQMFSVTYDLGDQVYEELFTVTDSTDSQGDFIHKHQLPNIITKDHQYYFAELYYKCDGFKGLVSSRSFQVYTQSYLELDRTTCYSGGKVHIVTHITGPDSTVPVENAKVTLNILKYDEDKGDYVSEVKKDNYTTDEKGCYVYDHKLPLLDAYNLNYRVEMERFGEVVATKTFRLYTFDWMELDKNFLSPDEILTVHMGVSGESNCPVPDAKMTLRIEHRNEYGYFEEVFSTEDEITDESGQVRIEYTPEAVGDYWVRMYRFGSQQQSEQFQVTKYFFDEEPELSKNTLFAGEEIKAFLVLGNARTGEAVPNACVNWSIYSDDQFKYPIGEGNDSFGDSTQMVINFELPDDLEPGQYMWEFELLNETWKPVFRNNPQGRTFQVQAPNIMIDEDFPDPLTLGELRYIPIAGPPNHAVTIEIRNPRTSQQVAVETINLGPAGYSRYYFILDSRFQAGELYDIYASAIVGGELKLEAFARFLVDDKEELGVTLNKDKDLYAPGDTALISYNIMEKSKGELVDSADLRYSLYYIDKRYYNPSNLDLIDSSSIMGSNGDGTINISIPADCPVNYHINLELSVWEDDQWVTNNIILYVEKYLIVITPTPQSFKPGDTIDVAIEVLNARDFTPAEGVTLFYEVMGPGLFLREELTSDEFSFAIPGTIWEGGEIEYDGDEAYDIIIYLSDEEGYYLESGEWLHSHQALRPKLTLDKDVYHPGDRIKVNYDISYEGVQREISAISIEYTLPGFVDEEEFMSTEAKGSFYITLPEDMPEGNHRVNLQVHTAGDSSYLYLGFTVEEEKDPSMMESVNDKMGVDSSSPFMLILMILAVVGVTLSVRTMLKEGKKKDKSSSGKPNKEGDMPQPPVGSPLQQQGFGAQYQPVPGAAQTPPSLSQQQQDSHSAYGPMPGGAQGSPDPGQQQQDPRSAYMPVPKDPGSQGSQQQATPPAGSAPAPQSQCPTCSTLISTDTATMGPSGERLIKCPNCGTEGIL